MAHTKTPLGQLAFKERSALMSNRQRSLFLLFDGVRSVDQILVITKALGSTQADIDHLVSAGLIEGGDTPAGGVPAPAPPASPVSPSPVGGIASSAPDAVSAPASTATPQERFARAWPMATQLTAGMGLRGFRLNLSIEGASGYDDLLALLPKIQAALGHEKCAALERVLKG
jgi:hypothetical protein